MRTPTPIVLAAALVFATPALAASQPAASAEPTQAAAPTETHKIDADGVTLTVSEWGEGEPVICLSGGPGFSADQMLSTATQVAKAYRAILVGQRGTAGSEVPEPFDPSQFSIARAVADLEAVRTGLGLDKITLVGHSWGGLLSMAYAAEHPERVKRLVLVGPAGIDSSFWTAYQAAIGGRLDDEARAALATLRPTSQTLEGIAEMVRQSNRLMAGATLGSGARAGALEALRGEMVGEGFEPRVVLAMQRDMMSYDLREPLRTLRAPVVVIRGAEDPIGPAAVDRIVETLPNAMKVELPGVGHWPFHEAPAAYAEALTDALGG